MQQIRAFEYHHVPKAILDLCRGQATLEDEHGQKSHLLCALEDFKAGIYATVFKEIEEITLSVACLLMF